MLGRGDASTRGGEREELIDLEQAILGRDDVRRLLVDEILAEPILAIHLEHEPAEVSDPVFAVAEEQASLAAERAGRRQRTASGRRRRCRVDRLHGRRAVVHGSGSCGILVSGRFGVVFTLRGTPAAEALEQRRHAGESTAGSGGRARRVRGPARGLRVRFGRATADAEQVAERKQQADDPHCDPDKRDDEEQDDADHDERKSDSEHRSVATRSARGESPSVPATDAATGR